MHIIVKYLNDPVPGERLTDVARMMFEFMQHDTALEFLEIFMKYLANTDNTLKAFPEKREFHYFFQK